MSDMDDILELVGDEFHSQFKGDIQKLVKAQLLNNDEYFGGYLSPEVYLRGRVTPPPPGVDGQGYMSLTLVLVENEETFSAQLFVKNENWGPKFISVGDVPAETMEKLISGLGKYVSTLD